VATGKDCEKRAADNERAKRFIGTLIRQNAVRVPPPDDTLHPSFVKRFTYYISLFAYRRYRKHVTIVTIVSRIIFLRIFFSIFPSVR